MKPFRERNPVIIGAMSLALIFGLLLAAFRAQDLPLIGGGDTYYANFKEIGGLRSGDEVRIAGVRVGEVKSIKLDGDHVEVAFRVKTDSAFGTDTEAAIKIKTLLGSEFLALQPQGTGQLKADSTIPVSRTTSPYDVVDAFSGLATTAGKINTAQLSTALTTLADLTKNTPADFKAALGGISALSDNIAAKNSRINSLLKNLSRVSTVLDARDGDIIKLMNDSNVLFDALVKRRAAIHRLLISTRSLSTQLVALVDKSKADLKPALDHLDNVVQVLNKNQDNIDRSLTLLAPFYRVFANTLGSGPWFDTYIQNLPPVPTTGGGVTIPGVPGVPVPTTLPLKGATG